MESKVPSKNWSFTKIATKLPGLLARTLLFLYTLFLFFEDAQLVEIISGF